MSKEAKQIQDAPGTGKSPEALSARDRYKKMRWDLKKLREDLAWWRKTLNDPRHMRVMDKFRADLKHRIYGLKTCAKSELETKQMDIRDRESFLKIMEQVSLEKEVEEAEANLQKFEDDNALFLVGLADLSDKALFEETNAA
ncbi:MAG: hypothetical protein ACOCVH_02150 [Verrucomicrobiota bacterium]